MENHKQNRNLALILLGFIVIMLVIAVCAIKPPKPVGSGAPQDQFASGRAMEHLAQIAAEPTPIGSVSHRQVWEYLLGELKALGLEAEIHETTMYNPYWRNAGNVANVIARIPGTDSSRAVALVAHYDTISLVPGASGSKAAIAAILEMLRVLSLREPLKNDLIILFADGGETGILGTLAFLEQHPWAEDVGLVIAAAARGTAGPVMMIESGRDNSWIVPHFAKAVDNPVANSFTHEVYRWLVNDTDFLAFKQALIPGLQLTFLDNARAFQTPLDNPGTLDESSLQHLGTYLCQLVTHFGNVEIKEGEADLAANRVYFDILGRFLVRYPIGFVAHTLTVAIILFGFVCWHAFKTEKAKLTHTAFGVLLFIGMAIFSMLITNMFFGIVQSGSGFYQYIPMTGGLWYYGAIAALVGALFFWLYTWALDKYRLMDLYLGINTVWLVVTVMASLYLPGASYAFVWPFLFSLAAAMIINARPKLAWPSKLAVLAIGSLPVLILWPYLLRTLFVILGYALPGLLSFMAVMAFGALLPHWASIIQWKKLVLPILAVITAAACLGMGIWSSQGDRSPHMDTLFYFADLDLEQAYWVSLDQAPDSFTEQVLGSEYQESNLGQFIPYEDLPVIYSQAALEPEAAQELIRVELLEDQNEGEVRRMTMKIQAAPEVNNLIIYIEPELLNGAVILDGDTTVEWEERWPVLRYYNPDADGFDLTIPAAVDQPFTMRILAHVLQLPAVGLTPRPENIISAPTGITDSTFVFKSYQF